MISDDQTRIIKLDDGVQAWIDTVTGLMWEVKNEQNITFMYTWRKGSLDKVAEDAIAYMEDEIKDCESYIDRMNEMKYAGYDDWRMPSISELETLLWNDGEATHVKAPLQHNYMSGVWSGTRVSSFDELLRHPVWQPTNYKFSVNIIDFRSMQVGFYDHEFALWIRAVRDTAA